MLRIGALNNDSTDISEPEPTFEIQKEAQESEALGLYHKALALQKAGNVSEAEKLYSDVLHTSLIKEVPCPSSMKTEDILKNSGLILKYTVYKNLADIAATEENYEKALDNYLEAALIDDSDVSLWWKIGDIALKVTNLKLARYSFEKGLLSNSNHWPCLENLVTVLFAIGDYAACLETIIKGLERDNMFIKGLVIRDQIFKEEPHFRKDYQEFNSLFVNDCKEDYLKEYSKYIEEALVLREKRCLLARKEDLPKIKLPKQITYYTWACLGDCLVHLYDELTNAENPKSLCRPIDLEKYSRSPEQQSLLAIPSPETNWKGTKNTNKDDDKKSLKRKKIASNLFEKEIEPIAKRRSARVKSSKTKEEDVNWVETLQSFLPEFLRSDSTTENEDSQDSLPEDTDTKMKKSGAELCRRDLEEARLVSDFINDNVRNGGCVDLLSNFIGAVANQSDSQKKWYHGLPQIFIQIYGRVRKHVQFPCLPPEASSKTVVNKFSKTLLIALELQLDEWLAMKSKVPLNFSPAQSSAKAGKKAEVTKDSTRPKGTHNFLSDLHYLIFLTSFEDVFKDFWVEFITRLYWLEARFFMLIEDTKLSLRAFDKCIGVLTPNNGINTNPNLCFRLENCIVDSSISLDNVQKKVESLKRCLSLEEVNKLYESSMYAEVVELLSPLLKQKIALSKSGESSAAPPERPTQLLLLQDSFLKLGQVNNCIICSEFAINEALEQMTPTEDWKIVINGFLNCLNSVLTENVTALDIESRDVVFRLVQSMIRIIEISMEGVDNGDIVLATSIPWLILYKIIKLYNQMSTNETQNGNQYDRNSHTTTVSPQAFRFICCAHDLLGRRGLCCDDDGLLLCVFVKDLRHFLLYQTSNSFTKKEDVYREIEQCFYCLYGHPSKKTKSRKLQDHVTSQIPLTWEYGQILYEHFKPNGLPTLDNKVNTISMEVQLLLRRIVTVVPQKDVEVIAFDTLQAYIDGLVDLPVIDETQIATKRSRVQDLFYYLADFYFKNKEFGKAIKFYMHDVCLNPSRFESWAAMALARGARLEEKISACEPKSDGPIRKHSISTLRCFEEAVKINNSNCMILEEYGSTAYMLNSQASRRLREHIQDEEYTTETVSTLAEGRDEMIQLAEKCFTQARKCVKKAEGEPWLHSYMLGKATEKLKKPPEVYLDFYQLAGQQLHTANANYPKRIPYHNPPEYSIEALEIYYRIHASILNLLQTTAGDLNYALIENHLNKADTSPFLKAISVKSIEKMSSKDDSASDTKLGTQKHQDNRISVTVKSEDTAAEESLSIDQSAPASNYPCNQTTPSLLESTENSNLTDYSQDLFTSPCEKNGPAYEDTESLYCTPKEQYVSVSQSSFDVNTTSQSQDTSTFPDRSFLEEDINSVSAVQRQEEAGLHDVSMNDDLDATVDRSQRVQQGSGKQPASHMDESLNERDVNMEPGQQIGESATKDEEISEPMLPELMLSSTSDARNIAEKSSIPSLSQSVTNPKFSSSEEESCFKKIVDRCLQALSVCLKRFPEHYKSQYKMAYIMTYFPTHMDLSLSRELLLGTNSTDGRLIPIPAHGLFTDRSKTNLFQYLWRIPIDEIDRRGSFCSHVSKAVELLLFVLSERKEWDTLLTISGLLHLTPSKDKKYLRDNDRAFLALKAFDMAKDILKIRIDKAESISRTEKKLLLLDCYEAYKLAQKMQTSVQITEHYLVKIFKMLLHQPENASDPRSPLPEKVILEQSLKFCLANVESSRKLSSMASSASSQSSQQTESQKEPLAEESKKASA